MEHGKINISVNISRNGWKANYLPYCLKDHISSIKIEVGEITEIFQRFLNERGRKYININDNSKIFSSIHHSKTACKMVNIKARVLGPHSKVNGFLKIVEYY